MPTISVIVPVYKVEPYLNRCVDSILRQTYQDFELILVDDGSPDRCGEICDEYARQDGRVHVIHKENGGLSDARNAGIDWVEANSDSQWLIFADSDDWVHPELLARLLDAATAFEVLSIDIADVDVAGNVGARLQAEQAEADKQIAQAKAEVRRAAAVATEQEMAAKTQEMRAKVVEAEAQIPMAMAEAFRNGNLGVLDYARYQNVVADTKMRDSIAQPDTPPSSIK